MSSERLMIDYLHDILDSIEKIKKFVDGFDYGLFSNDDKTVYAVVRAFEVMGEAAKKIPDTIRQSYPSIPWKSMAGMRDMLIHAYFGVDKQVLWRTIEVDLNNLENEMRTVVALYTAAETVHDI